MEKHSPFFLSQENRHHSWQLFAGSCSWYRSQSNGGTSVAISVILQTNVWTHGNHTIISSYFKIIFYKMLVISAKSGGGALRTQLRSMIGIYYLYCFYHSISFLGKCLRLHIAHILDLVWFGFVTWDPILRAIRSKWDLTQQIQVRQDPKYDQYVHYKIFHGMRITSGAFQRLRPT